MFHTDIICDFVSETGGELDRRNRENDQLSSALHRTRLELDQRTTELAQVVFGHVACLTNQRSRAVQLC